MNLLFNPFACDVLDLEPSHLAVLQDVAEGWYVEYKSELLNTRKIAKSLAAFANHYGGWIFYGVAEAADGSNTAGHFPGLNSQNEVPLLIERLRNAAKDVVNPAPYYEHMVLDGPCAEIGLPNDRSVIAVAVPSGPDAPYIHNDGKIYRRIADSSDPVPENDRFILDNLWQRRQLARDRLVSFLEKEPILSQAESNVSFVDIFLLTDPLGASEQRSSLNFSEFCEVMNERSDPGLNIEYDNIFTMSNGFVARYVHANDPYNLVLTLQHYQNGFSIITIPFSSVDIVNLDDVELWLRGYEQKDALLHSIRRGNHTSGTLLDINMLLWVLMASVEKHRQLLVAGGIQGPLFAKAAIRNVWRRTPFLDTESFIRFVNEYGLPIIQYDNEFSPPGKSYESLIPIREMQSDSSTEENDGGHETDEVLMAVRNQARRAGYVFAHILVALGLSSTVLIEEGTPRDSWSVWTAAERAQAKSRNH